MTSLSENNADATRENSPKVSLSSTSSDPSPTNLEASRTEPAKAETEGVLDTAQTGTKRIESKKKTRVSWYYSVLPYNVAVGPLGTFVSLYLLQLYGLKLGTIYVGLVTTAFNAVTIPSAMIWGFVTDKLQKRKVVICFSFFAIGANLFAFLVASNYYSVGILYAISSLLSSASATPLNLLIMESEPKPKWASSFARLSMTSSVGVTVGLVLSLFWTAFLPLRLLVIPLALLSLLSAVLALILIQEPSFVFEREIVVLHKKSFYQRLHSLPMMFLSIPSPSSFRKIFGGLRHEITSYTPVLYLSIVGFYIGSGIFNTSIVPAMYGKSLTESLVFLVTLVVMVVQIFSFRFVGPFIEKKTLVKSAVAGLVMRAVAYSLMGISFFLISGIWYLVPSLIFYPMSSGFAYAIYYTASNTLIFNTVGQSHSSRSRGEVLGVYSALVGMATMIGSFVSGFTSVYFGFHITFIIAGFCLAASAVLTSLLEKLGLAHKTAPLAALK